MGRNGNGLQRVGDTMVRRARRPPYPGTQQNTTTLPLRTRPTDVNKLHYTTLGQTKTQLTSTKTDVPATQTTFCDATTGSSSTEPTQTKPTHEVTRTTAHQPHRSCSRDLTLNRPHASRPTPNRPGVHGSQRELRQTGWQHHIAPRPPTTIPTNKTEHCDSAITQPTDILKLRRTIKRPTDQPQRPTSNPRPPGRAQARPSQDA